MHKNTRNLLIAALFLRTPVQKIVPFLYPELKKEVIPMICPYSRKSETLREVWKNSVDDETYTPSSGETIKTIVYKLMDCKKEQCGVYYNGRCHYFNSEQQHN